MRAHPRSRGENGSLDESAHTLTGSSPLTRGKRRQQLSSHLVQGLIPAHAGKTRSRRRRRMAWPAHPRSRGENMRVIEDVPAVTGSSPLTRGKLECFGIATGHGGLIPAHAGKTDLP